MGRAAPASEKGSLRSCTTEMPIDTELIWKLQQQQLRVQTLEAAPNVPTSCRGGSEPSIPHETHIDGELKERLRLRAQKNGSGEVNATLLTCDHQATPNEHNRIDNELLQKLHCRKSTLQQQEEQEVSPATKHIREATHQCVPTKMDPELAMKLRHRQLTIRKMEEQGLPQSSDVQHSPSEEELDQEVTEGDCEFVEKLARRRHVVDAEGDCYLMNRSGGGIRKLIKPKLQDLPQGTEESREETVVEDARAPEALVLESRCAPACTWIATRLLILVPVVAVLSLAATLI